MIKLENISKIYKTEKETFYALNDVSIEIKNGEFLSVLGHSGSGKSTLLFLIGGMIRPDLGELNINNESIYKLQGNRLNKFRRDKVGFIFQQFHLVPYLNVADNIRLSVNTKGNTYKINKLLEACNLKDKARNYPSQLSVGEKQRAAFIRAVVSGPEIILADEPTGNLDPENSNIIMKYLDDYNKKGCTVILVTHDEKVASRASRTVVLKEGRLV